jgi:hypothetical protein
MKPAMESLHAEEQKNMQKIQAEKAEKQKKAAAEAKAKEAAANAQYMKDPSFAALAGILGANHAKQYMQHGQSVVNTMKKHGVDLTPVEGGLIQSYIGSHYEEMNSQAYSGAMDHSQWLYRKALVEALSKMPIHTGTAVRGIKGMTASQWAKYQPGKVIDAVTIQSAGKTHKLWGNYELRIKNASARSISALNGEGGGEVIFMPDVSFKVISVKGNVAEVEQIGGHIK